MVALIEDFIGNKKKLERTVIVLDNAPIHKSEEFTSAIEEWQEKYDLFIFFLPAYSPHLNLIETLWRKMKCEWLKPQDYDNPSSLEKAVEKILNNVGKEFIINFAWQIRTLFKATYLINTLLQSKITTAGWQEVLWNGKNSDGAKTQTGVYLVTLIAENQRKTIQVVVQ